MDLGDLKYLHEKLYNTRLFYGFVDVIVHNMLIDNGVLLLQGYCLYVSKDYFFRLSTDFDNAIMEKGIIREIPVMGLMPEREFAKMITTPNENKPLFFNRLTNFTSYI